MKRRAAVFLEMLKTDGVDKATLDINNANAIIRLLDSVVIKLEGGIDKDLAILDLPDNSPRDRSHSSSIGPEDGNIQNGEERRNPGESKDKSKGDNLELAPVSPSSVPLPDAPPPPSAHLKKQAGPRKDEAGDAPDQSQEGYYQQGFNFNQQEGPDVPPGTEKPADPQAPPTKTPKDKEKGKKDSDNKKKRKRRHREPYYYDDVEESESESDSDSEPEPAPPGEEGAGSKGQEEELLPPGVEPETKPAEEPLPPGIEDKAAGSADAKADEAKPVAEEAKKEEETPAEGTDKKEEVTQAKEETSATKDEKEGKDVEMKEVEASIEKPATEEDKPAEESAEKEPEKKEPEKKEPEKKEEKKEEEEKEEPMETQPSETKTETQPEEQTQETKEKEPKSTEDPPKEEDKSTTAEKAEKPGDAGDAGDAGEEIKGEKEKKKEEEPKKEEAEVEEGEEKPEEVNVVEPRPLHKTFSLFMRNIPPKMSRNDVVSNCKRFPGFLRVSLSDPSPDRQFYRRGWITFDRTVNIKDLCWNLSNIRVKDIELNPVVNRDLQRRVRSVAGFTVCKPVVKADIRLAAKLIKALDTKAGLWNDNKDEKERLEKEKLKEEPEEGEEKDVKSNEGEEEMVELPTENPVLSSLSEDVAEEEEGEEMELLGSASPDRKEENNQSNINIKRDENLIKVLDRLLLYLRIVHSMDYYNGSEYPYEDEMPNRCGIIHVRGEMPQALTQQEISEWTKNLEQKLEPHLQEKELLTEDEADKLGKKSPDSEVEKFVQANTQELAKDKWLCPLSGKKFRGPEFVRKHIFNKQMEKIDAVKMEAEFFNNYLSDPKRPQVPEVKAVATPNTPANVPMNRGAGYSQGQFTPHGMQQMGAWNPQRTHMMMQQGHRGFHTPQYSNFGGHSDMYSRGQTFPPKPRRNFNQRGRGGSDRGFHRDPRQLVQYRDLDVPDDTELF